MLPQSLTGLHVLEWCEGVPGPYCGRLLAEFGAGVVKIEAPRAGDATRRMPPFKQRRRSGALRSDQSAAHPGSDRGVPPERSRSQPLASGLFFYCNAGKRGISLRPEVAGGRPLFEALAREADVLIEDRRPGLLDELGLGYKALRKLNPGLVLVSVTAFGQTGPYAPYKAYPLNLFHAGGEGYIQPGGPGYAAHPDRPPLMAGGNFIEAVCGSTAVAGVLAALLRRSRTGRGDHVDLSCQEALMELGRAEVSAFPNEGFIEERRIRWINLAGLLRTADGWVEMVVTEPRMWEGLVRAMGNPAWAADPRYATVAERSARRAELNPLIEAWTRSLPGRKVRELLQANQAPAFEVRTIAELARSPQYRARRFFAPVHDDALGAFEMPTTPFGGPKPRLRPAPRLGQHNAQVYGALGLRPAELRRLEAAGVI